MSKTLLLLANGFETYEAGVFMAIEESFRNADRWQELYEVPD